MHDLIEVPLDEFTDRELKAVADVAVALAGLHPAIAARLARWMFDRYANKEESWPTSQPPNPTPPAPTTNPKTRAEPTSTNPTPADDDTDQPLLDDGWPDVAKAGGAG